MPRPRKRGQQVELEFAEFTADKIRQNDFVNQVRDRAWYRQAIPLAEQCYEDYLKQGDIR